MAAKKDTGAEQLNRLKAALKSGELQSLYIFTGEESYLRSFYLDELRKTILPGGFEEFNFHRCEGKNLTVRELAEMAEAMPMMAERTLIIVTDFDPFALDESEREQFIALIGDWPDYCCLVLHYDLQPYKENKVMKKLVKAMGQFVVVEFKAQEKGDLINWLRRRFRALGKEIDAQAAEHLIFTCGSLMTGLIPEINKIAGYAKGDQITVRDINAVASPILDAEIFQLTNAVTAGKYDLAAEKLGELLQQQEEPVVLLSAIGKELRRIYTARMAIEGGKDKYWLMELWGMRSDYPAKLLLDAAMRVNLAWCRDSVKAAQMLDRRMKSEKGMDAAEELKRFLMELEQGARV